MKAPIYESSANHVPTYTPSESNFRTRMSRLKSIGNQKASQNKNIMQVLIELRM